MHWRTHCRTGEHTVGVFSALENTLQECLNALENTLQCERTHLVCVECSGEHTAGVFSLRKARGLWETSVGSGGWTLAWSCGYPVLCEDRPVVGQSCFCSSQEQELHTLSLCAKNFIRFG